MILLHMGAMHPYEKGLTLLLAFGPFLILAAVVLVRRRHERTAADQQDGPDEPVRSVAGEGQRDR
ncbi:MAG: hypothetical protein WBP61_14180 [Nocardioides sp.]